jgi:hypothetical protein
VDFILVRICPVFFTIHKLVYTPKVFGAISKARAKGRIVALATQVASFHLLCYTFISISYE